MCTPDGVTLLLIIFGYMNKSVLTALVVMPAIAASSLVGVTFANSNSVDTSSVKNGFQKQIQGGLNHLKWDHRMNGGMIHGMQNLTDDEKKSLESMTDTQKKEFFQKKMDKQKVKMDARDAVLDKLLNGESLSDADKVIVTEIKAERAKMKAERAQMDNIRTKIDKNETLTTEEQAFLDAHRPKGNSHEHRGKMMKQAGQTSSM